MRVENIEIDSQVFGRNVLAIHDFDSKGDFVAFEQQYIADFNPVYVACKIPLEQIVDTHLLERNGFNLIECQIRSMVKLRKPYDVRAFHYDFKRVTHEDDLREVLEIAGSTFTNDRFSMDLKLNQEISGERYRKYIIRSFQSEDEAVYRLIDHQSNRTVAFKTHRYLGETDVLFLLGGVHPDYKTLGLGPINSFFEFNELIHRGIKRGTTHISASNYPVLNLEIGNLGFRVNRIFAVMRKVYP